MQVKVTVHESRVDQLRPGMPARIIIQDQEYAGEVLNIANQPERTSWFSANVKEYATTVTISGENSALRPGMTAKVTILVDSVSDALTVPVSTVVEQRGKFYCWVRGQEGAERRPLILGRTNDKLIEIVDGVKEGDEVFRNPRAVTPEAREEGPFESQAPDAGFSLTGGVDDSSKGSVVDADAVPSEPPESGPSALSPAGQGAQATPDPTAGGDRRPDRPSGRGGRPSFDLMSFDQNGDQRVSRRS
jgi:hypothetical protein